MNVTFGGTPTPALRRFGARAVVVVGLGVALGPLAATAASAAPGDEGAARPIPGVVLPSALPTPGPDACRPRPERPCGPIIDIPVLVAEATGTSDGPATGESDGASDGEPAEVESVQIGGPIDGAGPAPTAVEAVEYPILQIAALGILGSVTTIALMVTVLRHRAAEAR